MDTEDIGFGLGPDVPGGRGDTALVTPGNNYVLSVYAPDAHSLGLNRSRERSDVYRKALCPLAAQ